MYIGRYINKISLTPNFTVCMFGDIKKRKKPRAQNSRTWILKPPLVKTLYLFARPHIFLYVTPISVKSQV